MKKLIKIVFYLVASMALLAVLLIAPIDNSPLKQQPFYHTMMKRLDTMQVLRKPAQKKSYVGWSQFNITPTYNMPMAGYTPKDKFESIHDSLYCRVLAIDNGAQQVFIISLDLMLFPPLVKDRLNQYIEKNNLPYFLYFTATHTHSSLGGWDDSVVGRFTVGKFHEEWLNGVVQKIIEHMNIALRDAQPSHLTYWEIDASEFVENRLDANSPVDGLLRGLKVTRSDSSKAVIASFSGHPTNMELLGRTLSGDYPSMLLHHLKSRGIEFGIFMAGMVGSHRIKGFDGDQFARIDSIGSALARKFDNAKSFGIVDSAEIRTQHFPTEFGSSQLQFEKGWKARDWAFRSLVGQLRGEITYLQIGNTILLGTPSDFSGELWAEAGWQKWCEENNQHVIITSFNGNYVGYITADQHYGKNEEEVLALNWVGPYFGMYFKTIIGQLIERNSNKNNRLPKEPNVMRN